MTLLGTAGNMFRIVFRTVLNSETVPTLLRPVLRLMLSPIAVRAAPAITYSASFASGTLSDWTLPGLFWLVPDWSGPVANSMVWCDLSFSARHEAMLSTKMSAPRERRAMLYTVHYEYE